MSGNEKPGSMVRLDAICVSSDVIDLRDILIISTLTSHFIDSEAACAWYSGSIRILNTQLNIHSERQSMHF